MKYYEQLASLKCFSLDEAEKLCGNKNTAKFMLKRYKDKGYIQDVKRNLYVTISLETHQPIANKFEIASHITKNSYVTHHSAFEYHGYSNQVYYEVFVSGTRFNAFDFNDITYRYISSPHCFGLTSPTSFLKVTDIERTLLDNIKDFEKSGGFEEIVKCIEMIPSVEEEKLKRYLTEYNNRFLFQKTGYILEHFKDVFRLSPEFFEFCSSRGASAKRYLSKNLCLRSENSHLDKKWNMIVPNDFKNMILQGGTELADI